MWAGVACWLTPSQPPDTLIRRPLALRQLVATNPSRFPISRALNFFLSFAGPLALPPLAAGGRGRALAPHPWLTPLLPPWLTPLAAAPFLPQVIEGALANAGMSKEQIDWLVLHQANMRILSAAADRLGVPADRVVSNLANYGNTSAASIPLALDEAVRRGDIKPGEVVSGVVVGAEWWRSGVVVGAEWRRTGEC